MVLPLVLAALALLLVAGCGEDEKKEASVQCDVYSESIIPKPQGKPQHIYFFSPT